MNCRLHILLVPCLLALASRAAQPPDLAPALATLRAVGPEGQGNGPATQAWRELAGRPATDLPSLLAAMNGANDLTRNWLRAAVDAIVARETAAAKPLPVAGLEAFLTRTTNDPRGRRLAWDLLLGTDRERAERLITGMLNDPAPELRREAVQRVLADADALRAGGNTAAALGRYQAALQSGRDVDQIEAATKALRELGQVVDLATVFGWLRQWQVIGPFDNTKRAGYETVFPPEQGFRADAEFDGKSGRVRWQPYSSTNEYGLVNLNQPLGALKEVTAYARTEFVADRARPAELRLGCKNAWKIWFNGRLLFGRDEYHRGAEIDQYRLPIELRAGANEILVKVCQNEQTEDWTVEWEFQLRLTDPEGSPLRPATPVATSSR